MPCWSFWWLVLASSFFFSGLLAPLLVTIVLAYLLEWPTARLQAIGCSRRWAASIVLILFVGILLLMAFVVMPIAAAGYLPDS